jgi:hypothetical protein
MLDDWSDSGMEMEIDSGLVVGCDEWRTRDQDLKGASEGAVQR